MTVKAILSAKGSDVATIEPTATLSEAIKQLAHRRIGALVVTGAEGRVIGILSERDVVGALAAHGSSALDQPLAEAMTRKVFTCRPAETVVAIMTHMTKGKFRHVPVVDNDQLAGIVSIGDVVKLRLEELEHEQEAMRDYIQTA